MILRTPPLRKRKAESIPPESSPLGSEGRLVVYEDPPVQVLESSHEHLVASEQMLCTYQCRQMVKSEFLDTLTSTEKLVSDYESKFQTLNDNLQKAEADKKKFHDQFLYAEQELAAAKGRELALQGQILKEVKDSQERLRKQIHLCYELEANHQKEMNMRKTAEYSAASAEEKAGLLERKLNHLSDSIERQKARFQEELTQFKRESALSVSRIQADLERMECRAQSAEKESGLLREQLEELTKQYDECLHQKNELDKKYLSITSQPIEVTSEESTVLLKNLQEELRNYESEVHEARKLKACFQDIEVLKEKFAEEKRRRERAETEVLKLLDVQQGIKPLEDELLSWKKTMEYIPGVSNAEDIPVKFAALQKEVIDSMEKVGEANAQLKQIVVALEAAELGKHKAETEARFSIAREESLKSENKHLESMLSSVTDERDHLKNSIVELRKQEKVVSRGETTNEILIQELESSLAKKDGFIKELETSIHELKAENSHHYNEIKLLNEKLISEAKRIKSLEREGDRLRSEICLLESKLGHGDYSATSTKVLRMVNTLGVESEARQAIEALQSELQKANEKLQVVEELKKQSADSGKLVDSYIAGKIVQLKDQIATLEKREERYKTVFADRISVFRRACCELFGYKIVMDDQQRPNGIPVTHFTLQSVYAQSDDEKLEFEYESGNTRILVNKYTSQREISQQVEIFIQKMNSIPAFTANLTIESFNRRTLS